MTALLLYGPVSADYSAREDVRAYVDELVSAHGFGRESLLETFAAARHQPRIVEAGQIGRILEIKAVDSAAVRLRDLLGESRLTDLSSAENRYDRVRFQSPYQDPDMSGSSDHRSIVP